MEKNDLSFLPILFGNIRKQIQKRHTEILTGYGLSSLHAMYLMCLSKRPKGMNQKNLTETLNVNKANTSRAVNDLIKKGYAIKENYNETKRNFLINLTKEGKDLALVLEKEIKVLHNQLLNVITEDEKKFLIKILKRMTEIDFNG